MESYQIPELWCLWGSQADLSNHLLWWFSITWWGRIGKFLEFIAACSIVAEIVGPDRLRQAARLARPTTKPEVYLQEIYATLKWIGLRVAAGFVSYQVFRGFAQAEWAEDLHEQAAAHQPKYARLVDYASLAIAFVAVVRLVDKLEPLTLTHWTDLLPRALSLFFIFLLGSVVFVICAGLIVPLSMATLSILFSCRWLCPWRRR